MNTPMIDTLGANENLVRPQETETSAVKDQEASSSQQANPINPSDDANKKDEDSNDMNTPMIDTLGANENLVRPQETETSAVKDQEASSSQQANPIDPSDDANKKDEDSNDMNTPMIDTLGANENLVRPQETETSAVKDQEASSSQQANPINPSDDANKNGADSTDMDTPTIDTLADMVRPHEIETAPAKDQEASSSQQANLIDPSDDANKKCADSNDMDTTMIDTLAANVNMVGPHDSEIAAFKDQDASQLDTGIMNNEPSPDTPARDNVEPLRMRHQQILIKLSLEEIHRHKTKMREQLLQKMQSQGKNHNSVNNRKNLLGGCTGVARSMNWLEANT